jgi:hypothetical protein
LGLALAVAPVVVAVAPSTSAVASPTLPVHHTVQASTTLATLHQTVTVPPGTFAGTIDLGTGALTGNLSLPPATTTIGLAGIGLVDATFQLAPTGPVTGTVNFSSLAVTATSTFDVRITSVEPVGLPINLVGRHCGTATPVSVTFVGTFSLSGASTFSGQYTMPPLDRCGLLTPALNVVIPGPGNQFSARFSPGG